MTTFEITITVLFVVIILLLLTIVIQFGVFLEKPGVFSIYLKMSSINSKLQSLIDISNQQQNAWACDVTSIVKRINELTDIVDKMHRNLCVEIADKMVDRVYTPTYVTPCYAPDGICTNPQMDCINCPKRSTGGVWTTSTNIIKDK